MTIQNMMEMLRWLVPVKALRELYDRKVLGFLARSVPRDLGDAFVDEEESIDGNRPAALKVPEHWFSKANLTSSTSNDNQQYVDALDQTTSPNLREAPAIQLGSASFATRRLSLVAYAEDELRPSTGSALTLTEEFLSDVKMILRCEKKISAYAAKLKTTEDELAELGDLYAEFDQQIQALQVSEDKTEQFKSLERAKIMEDAVKARHADLTQKLNQAKEEITSPRELFWQDLERVLAQHNLIDDIPDDAESNTFEEAESITLDQADTNPTLQIESIALYQKDQSLFVQPPLGIANVAEIDTDVTHQEAWELKDFAEAALQEARTRVENWPIFYEQEYEAYQELYNSGAIDTTKTEFDITLLVRQRQAGQELIQSEADLEFANDHAKGLGLCLATSQQESQLEDHVEDNILMSLDPDWVQRVDRVKIQEWLCGNPQYLVPADPGLAEEDIWPLSSKDFNECKGTEIVDFGESVSVVAKGKARSKIDRWRSMYVAAQTDDLIALEL
jgi:hypothetical protein